MAISEVSELCRRFSIKNTMHRFWFWMFMFEQRSFACVRCIWVGVPGVIACAVFPWMRTAYNHCEFGHSG
ncbi:hypothetical protein CR513_09223 [Mucuna pruriens]|uniref:Uncharacterized protein n=1 Tax=Mucuna pruriens TaxID=157652 RepID=A0A371HVC5_MUCPR|nr:hypothetical protein CR513_09223 [Mucuna pruriens]